MSRRALTLACLTLLSCGRTEPVRSSIEGEDSVPEPGRSVDGGLLCTDGKIPLQPAHPVVMLVVDRSNSMNQSFPGTGMTKWNALRGALKQALPAWNDQLMLGLHTFPSGSTASCTVSTTADLAPALQSVPQIITTLDSKSPGGSTPTALAIENAGAILKNLRSASSARALVLATDGAPDCNAALDPTTCTCVGGGGMCTANRCLDATRTIERIATLTSSNVPTWVIGLRSSNDAVFVSTLNRMAVAGGRPQTGTNSFFSAASQEELEAAFTSIRRQVGACLFLTTSVPDLGGSIELSIDGAFTPYDAQQLEGWSWVDPGNGELALHGDACLKALTLPIEALQVVVRCASP